MLDDWIAAINRRLPAATYEARHSFVEVAPWLALLTGAFGLLLGGRGLQLVEVLRRLVDGFLPSPLLVVVLLSPVLALAAIPGLRARRRWGWVAFAVSICVDLLWALFQFALDPLGLNPLLGAVFGALFLYFLLQTYSEYGRRYWR